MTLRRARLVAIGLTIAFVGYTAWWLADGGAVLDATMLRFTRSLLRGALDVVVSDSWPLGEPEVALAVVVILAALLARRRRYHAAGLVVGGFVVLSAVQLAILLPLAEVRHVSFDLDSLSRVYPSGHAARVPFLGTVLAMIAGPRARGWIVAATALLSLSLALDRTDSTIQAGSVVVGGLLLGMAVAAWFVDVYLRWEGDAAGRAG